MGLKPIPPETHCYWCRRPLNQGERSCILRELEHCAKRNEPLTSTEKTMTNQNRSQQAAAAVSGASTEAVVEERGRTHGRYEDMAATQVRLLEALSTGKNWKTLPAGVKVFLLATIQKMSRIVTGNPNEPDHYADIKGYAHLAHRTVTGEETVPDREAGEPQAIPGTGKAMLSNGNTVRVSPSASMQIRKYGGIWEDLWAVVHRVREIDQNSQLDSSARSWAIEPVVDELYRKIEALADAQAAQTGGSEKAHTNPMSLPQLQVNLKRADEIASFLIERSRQQS